MDSTVPSASSSPGTNGRRLTVFVLAAVFAYLAWFGGTGNHLTRLFGFRPHQSDYYNLLVEGMAQGHLWMNLAYDPAPGKWFNDVSPYQGHYYLYFGPTPVVGLLLPFRLLTGLEMPLGLAVFLFVAGGIILQTLVFRDAKRRYFPALGPGLQIVSLLIICFVSAGPVLLAAENFYETAEAAMYFCLSATWLAFYQALHRPNSCRRWLALASLCAGLAVGARPTAFLILPFLGLGALTTVRTSRRVGEWLKTIAAVGLPAGAIGSLLIAYNLARFGQPFEFGLTYQSGVIGSHHGALFQLRYLWTNLHWYFLNPPPLTPYFPYLLPLDTSRHPVDFSVFEQVHGNFLAGLLLISVAVCFLLAVRTRRCPTPLMVFLGVVAASFASVAALLCTYTYSADRYTVDFAGSLPLLLTLAAGWLAAKAGAFRRTAFAVLGVGAAATATLVGYNSTFVLYRHPEGVAALTRLANYPSYFASKLGLIHYGPHRLIVTFAPQRHATIEPLIATGSALGYDLVEAVQDQPDEVRIFVSHQGHGTIESLPIAFTPGQPHTIEATLGSFYPPRFHPYYDGWTPEEIDAVKTAARILFDGREVIRTRVAFYDSPPGNLVAGRDPRGTRSAFSGTVESFQRVRKGDPRTDPAFLESGTWRVRLGPNIIHVGLKQPVLAAGVAGAGNELFMETLPGGRIRFGVDTWNMTPEYSEPIATGSELHEVRVLEGGQVLARQPRLAASLSRADDFRTRLMVWWDGRLVWSYHLRAFADGFSLTGLGSNAQGFSSTGLIYAGAFESRPFSRAESETLVTQALATLGDDDAFIRSGTWRMRLAVDSDATSLGQPLLTGGTRGAGNELFLQKVGPHQIRFGLDTWGTGKESSPVVNCTDGLHEVTVLGGRQVLACRPALAQQLTASEQDALSRSLVVWWDGVPAWTVQLKRYPDSFNRPALGTNSLGFSSAAATYAGTFELRPFADGEAETFIARSLATLKLPPVDQGKARGP